MGPLSAVAIIFTFIATGGDTPSTTGGIGLSWWAIRPGVLGAIFIIAAFLIFIDTFWINSGARYTTWRGRNRQVVAQ